MPCKLNANYVLLVNSRPMKDSVNSVLQAAIPPQPARRNAQRADAERKPTLIEQLVSCVNLDGSHPMMANVNDVL